MPHFDVAKVIAADGDSSLLPTGPHCVIVTVNVALWLIAPLVAVTVTV